MQNQTRRVMDRYDPNPCWTLVVPLRTIPTHILFLPLWHASVSQVVKF
jgi:hypothetical protein